MEQQEAEQELELEAVKEVAKLSSKKARQGTARRSVAPEAPMMMQEEVKGRGVAARLT